MSSDDTARLVIAARRDRRQIALPSDDGLTLEDAYRVAARIRDLRTAAGERIVGRKVGFTNRTIWDEYGVDAPIWGYMYDTTVLDATGAPYSLAEYCEPRIEPEIAFGFRRAPEANDGEDALLAAIGWYAHGFEIVDSLFQGWKFRAADTVAAFGMHRAYLCGPRRMLTDDDRATLPAALRTFRIDLAHNGMVVDSGEGSNVLDSPLSALRHAIAVIAATPGAAPVAAGEIVTTGTVTRAFAVTPGETWSTVVTGLPLAGLSVTFS